ncbi:D-inositol-3-phosphate glycosyltransferase [uncultured archaeon]|nr:D-inositol-3-phosphate glycosyltransferase [uncultured archaeon]
MKKLCFFTGHYDPARQVIMNYLEKIIPPDISLSLFCAEKFDREKYSLKRTSIFEFTGPKIMALKELRKFCKENQIDFLITLTDSSEVALTVIYATLFTKTKVIFYFQGSPTLQLKNWLFLFYQFFIPRFLACSKEVSENIKRYLFFTRKKTFYLPHPVNVSVFSPEPKQIARKKIGLEGKKNIILYVGRVEFNQGSDYLLELVKKNPDKFFIFIGRLMDDNFKDLKLNNLKLIPFIENKKLGTYYSAADMSIFLSKRNSYPFPPRESLACETPVIVLDIEAFKSVPNNIMIKAKQDVHEIQKKIDYFFSLPEKEKKKLGKEGRKFIIGDSSEEIIKKKTLKYFFDFKKNFKDF